VNENGRVTDVAIIGLGAAGGLAAQILTEAGLDVVALEAGPRVDASMMTLDEVRNDVRSWLSAPKSRGEIPTWRPDTSTPAGPCPYPMLMVNAVGGTTVHYNCASLRFQPWHFTSRASVVERYGAGAIPPDSTLADWPLTYDELEPYYDSVEYAIGVSGQAGNIRGTLNPAGNPFEAPRRRDYPMPPLRPSAWNELMADAARSLDWHPFPIPAAINSRPYNGNLECTYCGFCSNNGCYRDAKGATDVTVIPRAEATGRLRVETSARVTRIEVDGEGLARGVSYVQDGREHFQPARAVLLGAFLYENVRLLLVSTSSAFPNGLANNHGQVGKHYMAHICPFVFGLFPGRRLNRFNGSGGQITCVDDWNADNFEHEGLDFVGGALLMSMHELKPIMAVNEPLPAGVPRWGSEWKAWRHSNSHSIGSAVGQIENISYDHNFLDLDPVAKDAFGMPLIRVTHRLTDHERRAWDFVCERLSTWLAEAGASETWWSDDMVIDGRHPNGGTRMGLDPETSVVDSYGFAHEVPNLGVIGASTFPTTGGHNPTLTLQALTWRTAEHLVDNWQSRSR
jgi:gluconate 2-dehydrogenase alpha chain